MVASQRDLTTKCNLCVFRSRMKYCCYARNTTDQALLQSQLELAFENTRSHGNLMVRTHHQLPFLFFPHHLTMCHLLFFHQALGVPCKSQQVTKYASYSKDTVDLLFRVLHGMPIAPVGIEHTHIKLALDEKLLQQDQERLGIEVAARLILISTYLANLLAPI